MALQFCGNIGHTLLDPLPYLKIFALSGFTCNCYRVPKLVLRKLLSKCEAIGNIFIITQTSWSACLQQSTAGWCMLSWDKLEWSLTAFLNQAYWADKFMYVPFRRKSLVFRHEAWIIFFNAWKIVILNCILFIDRLVQERRNSTS